MIVFDSRQQFTQHCSNVYKEKINFDQPYRSAIFLSFDSIKKVHCTVHFSVISQNLKKPDGSNNRLYVPEINSQEQIFR